MNLTPKTNAPYGIDVPGQEIPPGTVARKPARPTYPKGEKAQRTLRISDFCFIVAALAALGGMGLGIHMGMSQDFILAPAHAHLNLLGFVTMAIYGLYHRGIGRTGGLAGWLQVGSGALGAWLMSVGLGVYLATGSDSLATLIFAGPVLAVFAMLMFLGLVVADMLRVRSPGFGTAVRLG